MFKGLKFLANSDKRYTGTSDSEEALERISQDNEEYQSAEEFKRSVKQQVSRRGFLKRAGAGAAGAVGAVAAAKASSRPVRSFDAIDPEPIRQPKEAEYIISTQQPDKFTIVRKRERLTPSRCTVQGCQFDIAKKNGYDEGWDTVPRRERRLMLEALREHVKVAHNRSEDYIITESMMPKRWLGAERGLKSI